VLSLIAPLGFWVITYHDAESMIPAAKDYSLSQWVVQSVPAFAFVIVVLSFVIHRVAGVGWGELLRVGLLILVIQAAAAISMFWAVRYWRRAGDPRPGFALSGVYAIAIVPAVEHYASRWGLVRPQNVLLDAGMIVVITVGWLLFWSWWRWRRKSA
jgi:hypothetical protein